MLGEFADDICLISAINKRKLSRKQVLENRGDSSFT